jgi:transglutaminase-like putative cysteine protease
VSATPHAWYPQDARRLRAWQRWATWLTCAGGLGLIALLPGIAARAGLVGLGLLALSAPLAARLHLPRLRHAPACVALLTLPVAAFGPWGAAPAIAVALAVLLLLEPLAVPPDAQPGKAPLLTLLAALLACTLTARPPLAPVLALAGAAAAAALLLGGFGAASARAARSRAVVGVRPALALLGLLTLAGGGTLAAFLVFPRVPDRAPRAPVPVHRLLGYAPRVELGELGQALSDPSPLFRAQVTDLEDRALPGPLRFRAVAFDTFDGRAWSTTAAPDPPPPQRPGAGATIVQRIFFEPTAPPILVAAPRLMALDVAPTEIEARANGTLLDRVGPRIHGYQAWSAPEPATNAGTTPDARYLALPPTLDPAILALAREVGGDGVPVERARALTTWLTHERTYRLLPDPMPPADPLAAFLIEGRPGHCELFATSLAVLLRAAGIPSRLVDGFRGSEWNALGGYWLVRHADAHAWVEAWFPTLGWVTLDATPAQATVQADFTTSVTDSAAAAWSQRVLALDGGAQIDALAAPGARLGAALGVAAAPTAISARTRDIALTAALGLLSLAVLALAWRRLAPWLAGTRTRAPRPAGEVERAWISARQLLARRGWRPPMHLPPRSAAAWVVDHAGASAAPLVSLASLHYRVRYGGEDDTALAAEARAALDGLRGLRGLREAK